MLLEYVNDRADSFGTPDLMRAYYITRPKPDSDDPESGRFKSLDDVFEAFNDAYDAAANHVNKYQSKAPMGCDDAFCVLTGSGFGKRPDPAWDFMFKAMENADGAFQSNMILASAALRLYPDLRRELLGADVPDLSIRSVFGVDGPDRPAPVSGYAAHPHAGAFSRMKADLEREAAAPHGEKDDAGRSFGD